MALVKCQPLRANCCEAPPKRSGVGYDAWGNIRASASSGTMPTDIGYTGQRLDASTGGLMFYNARFYSSYLAMRNISTSH